MKNEIFGSFENWDLRVLRDAPADEDEDDEDEDDDDVDDDDDDTYGMYGDEADGTADDDPRETPH